MIPQHTAVGLLAGNFRWRHAAEPSPLRRGVDGTAFVEFNVHTSELRGNCRVTTAHLGIAYGATAVRIATTFDSDDLVVISGDIQQLSDGALAAPVLNVKGALRVSDFPQQAISPSLNVAYVIGTALAARTIRLRDDIPATVINIGCTPSAGSPIGSQHTVFLLGPARALARAICVGDTLRVDGCIGLHPLQRGHAWAIRAASVRTLERSLDRLPLLPGVDRSLERTA